MIARTWRSRLASFLLLLITYHACALFFFNDFWSPIGFYFFWHDRLDEQYWLSSYRVGLIVGSLTAILFTGRATVWVLAPSIFVVSTMTVTILIASLIVDKARAKHVQNFQADRLIERSFLESLENAPREFQSFLHVAALKDCKPFAWSYRTMSFYTLAPNVAINVLPKSWINECKIVRE